MIKPTILIITMLFTFLACGEDQSKESALTENEPVTQTDGVPKIKVLNFGTFHFGYTTDATKMEFDEHDDSNLKAAHEVAAKLAEFKPTVLIVEHIPERNERLQADYEAYLQNPDTVYANTGEVRMLAYELGRLAGTKRIYGIDHKMGYNYMIGQTIEENHIDSVTHDAFYEDPSAYFPSVGVNMDSLNLFDKLKLMNEDRFLDFLITVNSDALTYVGSEEGFEGADEAAKYYQRNLRMFSNLNRIKFNKDDRVFILMGGSHTAFFRDFISRSPTYEMVNTFDYLK
ncbi:DUF5694 domain-containing protein [Lentiprolixibacter aurantiacus]|uniref:DUF5694 domain-containing protein n=1 Tax=Lentiprolixibacter aurantiacus TaxID=2993939 RepID=A0AAE3MIU6_9FLAO|nr:DUF5694 domain-containing protein [Lentiprolixibacter aurantiacus]MCX2718101.1 DUF5694 domain-containing protein [Lentiprolixibacter aurantiacus]